MLNEFCKQEIINAIEQILENDVQNYTTQDWINDILDISGIEVDEQTLDQLSELWDIV